MLPPDRSAEDKLKIPPQYAPTSTRWGSHPKVNMSICWLNIQIRKLLQLFTWTCNVLFNFVGMHLMHGWSRRGRMVTDIGIACYIL
jgi:hypothetical protein